MGSTLNRTGETRPDVTRGHGTASLGPSDSSDTGSDVVGGPGMGELEPLDLDRGTTSDPNQRGSTAGPDLGDSDLDSDSDAGGTGENIAAGRDPVRLNQDREPDRIVSDPDASDGDIGFDASDSGETGGEGWLGDAEADDPDAVPSIDRPPPARHGSDVPVTDRSVDTPPSSGSGITPKI